MTKDKISAKDASQNPSQIRELPDAAKRALKEADDRRSARLKQMNEMPQELGGRDGPEPVRYGDWERKGIAVDF